MPEALIVDTLRTPTRPWEEESGVADPVALAATALQGLLDRQGVAPSLIDELVFGGVAGVDSDLLARQVALVADLPWYLPASAARVGDIGGLAALKSAKDMIWGGSAEIVLVGGVGHPVLGRATAGSRHAQLAPSARWRHGLEDPELSASWQARRLGLEDAALQELVRAAAEAAATEPLPEELVPCEGAEGDWIFEDRLSPAAGAALAATPAQGAAGILLASTERPDGPELPARGRLVGVRAGAVDLARTWGGSVVALRRLLAELVMGLDEIDLLVLDGPFAATQESARRDLGLSEDRLLPQLSPLGRGRVPGANGLMALSGLLAELESRDLRYGAVLVDSLDGQGICALVDRETYF